MTRIQDATTLVDIIIARAEVAEAEVERLQDNFVRFAKYMNNRPGWVKGTEVTDTISDILTGKDFPHDS